MTRDVSILGFSGVEFDASGGAMRRGTANWGNGRWGEARLGEVCLDWER